MCARDVAPGMIATPWSTAHRSSTRAELTLIARPRGRTVWHGIDAVLITPIDALASVKPHEFMLRKPRLHLRQDLLEALSSHWPLSLAPPPVVRAQRLDHVTRKQQMGFPKCDDRQFVATCFF